MKTIYFIFSFFILSTFLFSTIINIPADQPTIQEGIEVAVDGDTVLVQPGTYYENINYNGKLITVGSLFLTTQDTTYISQTIIDGCQNGSVIIIGCSDDSTATICGFTIKNGLATAGGGIRINVLTSPTVTNNIISNNQAEWGGGIYNESGSPLIQDNIIKDNISTFIGGGIAAYYSDIKIIGNIIENNQGSGIHIESTYYNILIENNIISNNYGSSCGGGICFYCELNGARVRNNLIIENYSTNEGSAICFGDTYLDYYELSNNTIVNNGNTASVIYLGFDVEAYFFNNIIRNGSNMEIFCYENDDLNVLYSNIYGGYPGIGNIDESPNFVDSLYDFHLRDNSTSIGAGIDEFEINEIIFSAIQTDLDGNPRPNPVGSMPDMGAYENPFGEPQLGINIYDLSNIKSQLNNYPNPFNPTTTINYSLKENSKIELNIYNIKGRKVKTIVNEKLEQGLHKIIWDGTNSNGKAVGSGIYFYKLNVNGKTEAVKKCLLLK
jgi:parallel beta-helix repeat protein